MRRQGKRLGPGRVALLPPAAYAVHELRYELAYGVHASAELRATGHSYLHSVVPWLVALIGIAVGSVLLAAGRAFASRATARTQRLSLGGLWALSVVALLLIFSCQETLEGIFATGHPGGWAAVFGDGGWWAVPVACGIGLLLALVFRGADWVVDQAARLRGRRAAWPRTRPSRVRATSRFQVPAPAPLLAGWSNRGPPSAALAVRRA